MHSLRTKITILTAGAILIALITVTVLAAFSIKKLGNDASDDILYLMCKSGQNTLNSYFDSVEQSVRTLSDYASEDLKNVSLDNLGEHMERIKVVFEKTASNTTGALTYYYRVDPTVSQEKGFWFVKDDNGSFYEHEVTNISLYDTDDQSSLVWFTVPKAEGRSIWLAPYVTENLGAYVISYNVPIYQNNLFIGVVGIEIDYNTLKAPVDSIKLYKHGYAFINDSKGTLIYHPYVDVSKLNEVSTTNLPVNTTNSTSPYFDYKYNGENKQAVKLPLHNGMFINVTVPVSEINADWQYLINKTIIISAAQLIVFVLLTMRLSSHITQPLRSLTKAAEQVDRGNYDVRPEYKGKDEVGTLTRTFNHLVSHLKVYITDLNNLAYADALTNVHNKGAFDLYVRDLQLRIEDEDDNLMFSIGVFDCNDLKFINDNYGHDKGDLYLKAASSMICSVFKHSPVFRTGGDEFTVVLQNDDYRNRKELMIVFEDRCRAICEQAGANWEKVSVAMGIAVYDPNSDRSVLDVVRRADKLMYKQKREQKKALSEN